MIKDQVERETSLLTEEDQEALREPFPEEKIGKLPRVTCKACRESPGRVCDHHTKAKCEVCGQWMTTAHMHLDYVGHADVTDRLLEVDRYWSWEPLGVDERGLPVIRDGGLWIKLTVKGVTRLGFGDSENARNPNPKVLIGDAIRNAAMRFGVALDLWRKELHESDGPGPDPAGPLGPSGEGGRAQGPAAPDEAQRRRVARIWARAAELPALRAQGEGEVGGDRVPQTDRDLVHRIAMVATDGKVASLNDAGNREVRVITEALQHFADAPDFGREVIASWYEANPDAPHAP
jgi:hypothetical protein